MTVRALRSLSESDKTPSRHKLVWLLTVATVQHYPTFKGAVARKFQSLSHHMAREIGWLVAWLSLVKEGRISFISVKYPLKSSEASCSYSCPHNVAILQSQIRAIGNYNKRQVSVSSFYCRSDYKFDQGPKLV